jgi:hypothetical protein
LQVVVGVGDGVAVGEAGLGFGLDVLDVPDVPDGPGSGVLLDVRGAGFALVLADLVRLGDVVLDEVVCWPAAVGAPGFAGGM